jgi:F-type H+-transporting ATPase subunit b
MFDTYTWYAIAFVLFVAVIVWKAGGTILGMLDGYRDTIRTQINEAQTLRARAEALLEETQMQRQQADVEARALIERAQQEAELLKKQSLEQLQKDMARREQQAAQRIVQAEQAMMRDLQQKAVDAALERVKASLVAA